MKKFGELQKVDFHGENGEIGEDLQKQTSVESTMDVYEVTCSCLGLFICLFTVCFSSNRKLQIVVIVCSS